MTPSKKSIQLCGLTLEQVASISGVPRRTLHDWCKTKPFVFAAVCEKAGRYEQKLNREYGGGA